MMLNWQEEKKTCSEIVKVDLPSSDQFSILLLMLLKMSGLQAKIHFFKSIF